MARVPRRTLGFAIRLKSQTATKPVPLLGQT